MSNQTDKEIKEPLFPAETRAETQSQKQETKKEITASVMEKNAPWFLAMAAVYGICFAFAFYRNYTGITFPLITAATLIVCGLFLKKNGISWKKNNWWYVGACLLLGISTVLTANEFFIFFNTVGILLLITVFMLRQMYDDRDWSFGKYVANLLFLYLSMIPELAAPVSHAVNYLKKQKREKVKNKNTTYILLGILLGLPMLAAVVGLLSSADRIFSSLVKKLFIQVEISPNILIVLLLILLGFFGIYSFLSALTLNNLPQTSEKKKKQNPLTAITFLSMVTAVYVIFCGIQVVFLFTGGLLLPEGCTYAEYAHQGFFQLLFVCIFNLILVLCCMAVFEVNKLLKLLLLLCSGCTYIMIASSAVRMILYIGTYHLSFLRVLVLWFLALLVVLLAGVILTVLRPDFGLFRYCTTVVTVFYAAFSFAHPDYFIAKYNVAQMGTEISVQDVQYLTGISLDAASVLGELTFSHENCWEEADGESWYDDGSGDGVVYERSGGCRRCLLDEKFQYVLDRTEGMNFRTFNMSKYLAKKAAEHYFSAQTP